MIAPRLRISYKGREYVIEPRHDVNGAPWAIHVAGGWYFLTLNDDPDRAADRFLLDRLRNTARPQLPGFLASAHHPLLLTVDGVAVRAWPAEVPRGHGASTYENPATGDRVATTKRDPYWMFAAPGRPSSPGGTAFPEQTVDDVGDLARIWLRGAETP
jgi:hypothetical protein